MEVQTQDTEQPQNTENEQRYLLQAELLSVNVYNENKHDHKHKYYFEAGPRFSRNRVPTDGNLKLNIDSEDEIPTSLTLFSQVVKAEEGKTYELPIWLKKVNEDFMKLDDVIAYYKIRAKLGGNADVITLKEAGTQLKIMVSANRTEL